MSRQGFTLLEVVVVVAIMAIAAAAVSLHIQGPLATARRDNVFSALRSFDAVTRAAARAQDRAFLLNVDLGSGRLERQPCGGAEAAAGFLALPAGLRLTTVAVRQHIYSAGRVSILCSALGLTPSYAIEVDTGAGRRRWLVVAGLTGEAIETADENQARALLAGCGVRTVPG